MEGHWKFQGDGGLKSQNFEWKVCEAKLEFSEGQEGSNKKNIHEGGMNTSWNNAI